ncbi:hypothetical protein MHBO_003690 [Bonamia ostreae]|uniref:Uncharacterized protein n=1 Tax=Bonamia ostreae TaxID=126728 RepID=A0ABV2AR87_9EUKA
MSNAFLQALFLSYVFLNRYIKLLQRCRKENREFAFAYRRWQDFADYSSVKENTIFQPRTEKMLVVCVAKVKAVKTKEDDTTQIICEGIARKLAVCLEIEEMANGIDVVELTECPIQKVVILKINKKVHPNCENEGQRIDMVKMFKEMMNIRILQFKIQYPLESVDYTIPKEGVEFPYWFFGYFLPSFKFSI